MTHICLDLTRCETQYTIQFHFVWHQKSKTFWLMPSLIIIIQFKNDHNIHGDLSSFVIDVQFQKDTGSPKIGEWIRYSTILVTFTLKTISWVKRHAHYTFIGKFWHLMIGDWWWLDSAANVYNSKAFYKTKDQPTDFIFTWRRSQSIFRLPLGSVDIMEKMDSERIDDEVIGRFCNIHQLVVNESR